jgi:hypothetical protein
VIIVEKERNEGMNSSISGAEIPAEEQHSTDVENSKTNQVKNKMPDFVISSDQMPC